jgi:PiT family inorganic phosphate transporter
MLRLIPGDEPFCDLYRSSPGRVDRLFRRLRLVSAAFDSLGYGTNDAQKTMGIIASLLFAAGYLGPEFFLPFWVIMAGMGITKRKPVGGFCAETAGSIMLLGTAVAGIQASTTHTITGAIVGVGATTRLSAVRSGIAGRIVWAWILMIPAAALILAGTWALLARLG